MELIFLQISVATHKTNFLQHIHNLQQIKLDKGDTYNSLFNKIENHFKDCPKELETAKEWILFNKDGANQSDFETVICEQDNIYAVFDLHP